MRIQFLAYLMICACSTGVFAAFNSEPVHSREISKLLNTIEGYEPEPSQEKDKQHSKTELKYLIKPKIKYPKNLEEFGNQGKVRLDIEADQVGNVIQIITLDSVHPELEQAAVQAMLKAKFEPLHEILFVEQVVDFGIQGNPLALYSNGGVDPFKIPKASKKLPPELQYDEPPAIKVAAPVVYPYSLLKENKKGKAKVYVLIGPTGRVQDAKILSASAPEFGLAARSSFQSWQFYPARKDKQGSWSIITKEYEFNSSNRDTKLSDSANQILFDIKRNKGHFVNMQQLDHIPKPLYAPLPPNVSKGKTNKVHIEFYLDKEGLVQLPSLQHFDNEEQAWLALTAVKRWQFEVPRVKGKPVIAKLVLPLEFK